MTDKRVSELSGELILSPQIDVPFAPGFDLEALRQVDDDPRFVVMKIKAGRGDGGRGPLYGTDILRSLERQINEKRPPGYRGHQKADNVEWEWREPVTAWVGARYESTEDALYIKGYIPTTAAELRHQLDLAQTGADVINSVSIWGLRDVKGDNVQKYDLWSIDWTPKGRAGMETELVSVTGEQQRQEETMERDEILRSIVADEVPDHVKEQLRNEGRDQAKLEAQPDTALVGEMRVILEMEEAEHHEILGAVKDLVVASSTAELETRVAELASDTDTISGEMMLEAVSSYVLPRLKNDASDEEIKGEIATAIELPFIKALGGSGKMPVVTGGVAKTEAERKGTAWV